MLGYERTTYNACHVVMCQVEFGLHGLIAKSFHGSFLRPTQINHYQKQTLSNLSHVSGFELSCLYGLLCRHTQYPTTIVVAISTILSMVLFNLLIFPRLRVGQHSKQLKQSQIFTDRIFAFTLLNHQIAESKLAATHVTLIMTGKTRLLCCPPEKAFLRYGQVGDVVVSNSQ